MIAIKQQVMFTTDGVIEIRSAEFHAGDTAEVIVLVNQNVGPDITKPPKQKGSWRRFSGAFNSGDPHSADNERIDADLARSYGATNEPTDP